MALSRLGSYFFMTIGCAMLVLATSTFICACIALSKLIGVRSGEGSIGFLGLYFIAPGVLCILSGCKQGRAVLGAGIATNTMGTVAAIAGLINSAIFWAIRDDNWCGERRYDYNDYDQYNEIVYSRDGLSCSDSNAVLALHGTNTIVFALLIIISFVGSIYGCVCTCCTAAPQEYYTLVSTSEPVQSNVMVTTTNQLSQQTFAQGFQPPPYLYPDMSGQDRRNTDHGSNSGGLVNV